jgi:hypothetical protein
MKRRHPLLAFAAVLLGLAALLPTASTASAAPPDNDDFSGATVLGPVPFHLEQDTTEATTSAEEAAFNDEFCGAPAFEHAVWFTATAIADSDSVVADVTGSDYAAGILVLTGEPGNFTALACQPGTVQGPVVAGQTIYLVVFGDGTSEATSGHLVLDTYLAPPPPSVDVTIDPRGTVDKAGLVHISGTVSCTSDDPEGVLFDVSGNISQRVGRGSVDGFFFSEQLTPCDGVTRAWSADAFAESGKFAGGKAATLTFAFGCDTLSCGDGFVEATIQLSRNGK